MIRNDFAVKFTICGLIAILAMFTSIIGFVESQNVSANSEVIVISAFNG